MHLVLHWTAVAQGGRAGRPLTRMSLVYWSLGKTLGLPPPPDTILVQWKLLLITFVQGQIDIYKRLMTINEGKVTVQQQGCVFTSMVQRMCVCGNELPGRVWRWGPEATVKFEPPPSSPRSSILWGCLMSDKNLYMHLKSLKRREQRLGGK